MAWRITEDDLKAIVTVDSSIRLEPFVQAGNALADKVSSNDSDSLLSAALLFEIERYLAAHFYSHRDQLFQAKATDKASATFQGKTDMGLRSTQYGQAAISLDVTGYLGSLDKGARTQFVWLGKSPSDQTDYVDRD
jgi:hypothetical protein